MQIQLKQAEIIEGLKQFIAKQGISLQGKTVGMAFTAGRGDTGLSVTIDIEDATIPGTEVGDVVESAKSSLSVVSAIKGDNVKTLDPRKEEDASGTAEGVKADGADVAAASTDSSAEVVADAAATGTDGAAVKTTSLFS